MEFGLGVGSIDNSFINAYLLSSYYTTHGIDFLKMARNTDLNWACYEESFICKPCPALGILLIRQKQGRRQQCAYQAFL